jgi:hypothetical protein
MKRQASTHECFDASEKAVQITAVQAKRAAPASAALHEGQLIMVSQDRYLTVVGWSG